MTLRPPDELARIRRRSLCEKACEGVPDSELEPGLLRDLLRLRDRMTEEQIMPVAQYERMAMEKVLESNGGNVKAMAKTLGISKTNAYRKLRDYGLR